MNNNINRFLGTSGHRGFLQATVVAVLGVVGAGLLQKEASAQCSALKSAVLNFSLNLEYLEAEYYTYVVTRQSITALGIGVNKINQIS